MASLEENQCGSLLLWRSTIQDTERLPSFPLLYGKVITIGSQDNNDIRIKSVLDNNIDAVLSISEDTGYVLISNPHGAETMLNMEPLVKCKYLIPGDTLLIKGKHFVYKSDILTEEDIAVLKKENAANIRKVARTRTSISHALLSRVDENKQTDQQGTPVIVRKGFTFQSNYVTNITPSRTNYQASPVNKQRMSGFAKTVDSAIEKKKRSLLRRRSMDFTLKALISPFVTRRSSEVNVSNSRPKSDLISWSTPPILHTPIQTPRKRLTSLRSSAIIRSAMQSQQTTVTSTRQSDIHESPRLNSPKYNVNSVNTSPATKEDNSYAEKESDEDISTVTPASTIGATSFSPRTMRMMQMSSRRDSAKSPAPHLEKLTNSINKKPGRLSELIKDSNVNLYKRKMGHSLGALHSSPNFISRRKSAAVLNTKKSPQFNNMKTQSRRSFSISTRNIIDVRQEAKEGINKENPLSKSSSSLNKSKFKKSSRLNESVSDDKVTYNVVNPRKSARKSKLNNLTNQSCLSGNIEEQLETSIEHRKLSFQNSLDEPDNDISEMCDTSSAKSEQQEDECKSPIERKSIVLRKSNRRSIVQDLTDSKKDISEEHTLQFGTPFDRNRDANTSVNNRTSYPRRKSARMSKLDNLTTQSYLSETMPEEKDLESSIEHEVLNYHDSSDANESETAPAKPEHDRVTSGRKSTSSQLNYPRSTRSIVEDASDMDDFVPYEHTPEIASPSEDNIAVLNKSAKKEHSRRTDRKSTSLQLNYRRSTRSVVEDMSDIDDIASYEHSPEIGSPFKSEALAVLSTPPKKEQRRGTSDRKSTSSQLNYHRSTRSVVEIDSDIDEIVSHDHTPQIGSPSNKINNKRENTSVNERSSFNIRSRKSARISKKDFDPNFSDEEQSSLIGCKNSAIHDASAGNSEERSYHRSVNKRKSSASKLDHSTISRESNNIDEDIMEGYTSSFSTPLSRDSSFSIIKSRTSTRMSKPDSLTHQNSLEENLTHSKLELSIEKKMLDFQNSLDECEKETSTVLSTSFVNKGQTDQHGVTSERKSLPKTSYRRATRSFVRESRDSNDDILETTTPKGNMAEKKIDNITNSTKSDQNPTSARQANVAMTTRSSLHYSPIHFDNSYDKNEKEYLGGNTKGNSSQKSLRSDGISKRITLGQSRLSDNSVSKKRNKRTVSSPSKRRTLSVINIDDTPSHTSVEDSAIHSRSYDGETNEAKGGTSLNRQVDNIAPRPDVQTKASPIKIFTSTARKGRRKTDIIFRRGMLSTRNDPNIRRISESIVASHKYTMPENSAVNIHSESPVSREFHVNLFNVNPESAYPNDSDEISKKDSLTKEPSVDPIYGKYSTLSGSPVLSRLSSPSYKKRKSSMKALEGSKDRSLTYDVVPQYEDVTMEEEEQDLSDSNCETEQIDGVENGLEVSGIEKIGVSPKNDLRNVSGLKHFFARCSANTPNVDGVKQLFKNKSPLNDLTNVEGVRSILRNRTPLNDLSKIKGVKETFRKDPANDIANIKSVKHLFEASSPINDLTNVEGVQHLFKIHNNPKNDLTNVEGVRETMRRHSPRNDLTNVANVKRVFDANTPNNDLRDIEGVKNIFKRQNTPKNDLRNVDSIRNIFKRQNTPKNDLTNVTGVKRILEANTPKNDLTNVCFIKNLYANKKVLNTPNLNEIKVFKTPKAKHLNRTELSGVKDLFEETGSDEIVPKGVPSEDVFDTLVGRQSYRTYNSKSIGSPEGNSKVINDNMTEPFESMKKKRKISKSLRTSVKDSGEKSILESLDLFQIKSEHDSPVRTPSLKHTSTPITRSSARRQKRNLVVTTPDIGNSMGFAKFVESVPPLKGIESQLTKGSLKKEVLKEKKEQRTRSAKNVKTVDDENVGITKNLDEILKEASDGNVEEVQTKQNTRSRRGGKRSVEQKTKEDVKTTRDSETLVSRAVRKQENEGESEEEAKSLIASVKLSEKISSPKKSRRNVKVLTASDDMKDEQENGIQPIHKLRNSAKSHEEKTNDGGNEEKVNIVENTRSRRGGNKEEVQPERNTRSRRGGKQSGEKEQENVKTQSTINRNTRNLRSKDVEKQETDCESENQSKGPMAELKLSKNTSTPKKTRRNVKVVTEGGTLDEQKHTATPVQKLSGTLEADKLGGQVEILKEENASEGEVHVEENTRARRGAKQPLVGKNKRKLKTETVDKEEHAASEGEVHVEENTPARRGAKQPPVGKNKRNLKTETVDKEEHAAENGNQPKEPIKLSPRKTRRNRNAKSEDVDKIRDTQKEVTVSKSKRKPEVSVKKDIKEELEQVLKNDENTDDVHLEENTHSRKASSKRVQNNDNLKPIAKRNRKNLKVEKIEKQDEDNANIKSPVQEKEQETSSHSAAQKIDKVDGKDTETPKETRTRGRRGVKKSENVLEAVEDTKTRSRRGAQKSEITEEKSQISQTVQKEKKIRSRHASQVKDGTEEDETEKPAPKRTKRNLKSEDEPAEELTSRKTRKNTRSEDNSKEDQDTKRTRRRNIKSSDNEPAAIEETTQRPRRKVARK